MALLLSLLSLLLLLLAGLTIERVHLGIELIQGLSKGGGLCLLESADVGLRRCFGRRLFGALRGVLRCGSGVLRDLWRSVTGLGLRGLGGRIDLRTGFLHLLGSGFFTKALLVTRYALQLVACVFSGGAEHRGLIGLGLHRLLGLLRGVLGDLSQSLLHGGTLGQLTLQFCQRFLWIILRILCHIGKLGRFVIGLVQRLFHAQFFLHFLKLRESVLRDLLALLHLGKVFRELLQCVGCFLLGLSGLLQGL